MGPRAAGITNLDDPASARRDPLTPSHRGTYAVGHGRAARWALLLISVLALPSGARALPLLAGDVLVLDVDGGGAARIVRIDPLDGSSQQLIPLSSSLPAPAGIAVDPSREIIVSHGGDTVVRVNPATGSSSAVSQGGLLANVGGVAVEADGSVLVADATNGVVRIDTIGGQEQVAALPGAFDLTLDPTGLILASDANGGLFEIDPQGGPAVSLCPGGCPAGGPLSIVVAETGQLFVVDAIQLTVDVVNRTTGARTPISDLGFLGAPAGIAVAADGTLLVADTALVIGLDPTSLFPVQELFSVDNLLAFPAAIAVVPEPGTLPLLGVALLISGVITRSVQRSSESVNALSL